MVYLLYPYGNNDIACSISQLKIDELLKIFSYLSVRDLIRLERDVYVCLCVCVCVCVSMCWFICLYSVCMCDVYANTYTCVKSIHAVFIHTQTLCMCSRCTHVQSDMHAHTVLCAKNFALDCEWFVNIYVRFLMSQSSGKFVVNGNYVGRNCS